jgi:hypothetical protein
MVVHMAQGAGEVVSSECSLCDVLVHWKVVDADRNCSEWQPLDAPTSFVCEHSQDHHEASFRARENPSGRAYSGPVKAKFLSRRGLGAGR